MTDAPEWTYDEGVSRLETEHAEAEVWRSGHGCGWTFDLDVDLPARDGMPALSLISFQPVEEIEGGDVVWYATEREAQRMAERVLRRVEGWATGREETI